MTVSCSHLDLTCMAMSSVCMPVLCMRVFIAEMAAFLCHTGMDMQLINNHRHDGETDNSRLYLSVAYSLW